jgi:hypothetical protein
LDVLLKPSILQVDAEASLRLLLDSLLSKEDSSDSVLKHLLLELLPSDAVSASDSVRKDAAILFLRFCNPQEAKLAVKLAAAFSLSKEDLGEAWPTVQAAVKGMLPSRSLAGNGGSQKQLPPSNTAAVRLLMHFKVRVSIVRFLPSFEVIAAHVAWLSYF